jgi:hypothetical protein
VPLKARPLIEIRRDGGPILLLLAALCMNSLAASANVITDWDEKAVALLQPRFVPPVAYRAMAIIELAMFEAVNSIDQHYQPYRAVLPATRGTSQEAAAATAAATAMTKLVPDAATDIQAAGCFAAPPDGTARPTAKLGTETAEGSYRRAPFLPGALMPIAG